MKFLKEYLESKWLVGMNWQNYGTWKGDVSKMTWHIDHVIPCSLFDLSSEEEQKRCFHYSNLQPLWAVDNLEKGNSVF